MLIDQIYKEFLASAGVSTDTRKDLKNTLFFALKGDQFDANLFVEKALEKSCRLAITERKDLDGREGVLRVDSVLRTLQDLARRHRRELDLPVLAITGSNGKTTTKELVASVLSKKFRLAYTRGNLNNHIGVPLTLLEMKDEEVAVIEMGANHPGEIAELAAIAEPNLGLITNVGKAHLEGFGSVEGVLNAKGELYDFLASKGGKALVDGAEQALVRKAGESGVQILLVAPGGELNVLTRLKGQEPFLELEIDLGAEVYDCSTRLVGAYNLQNIKMAVAVGLCFEVAPVDIVEAISSYNPGNQRSQLIEGVRNRVVLDSYNANPSSMRLAVEALLSYSKGPRMLILGDMAELGASSREEHLALVRWLSSLEVDRILLIGPQFFDCAEPSGHILVFRGREEAGSWIKENSPAGFHILLKGSRVMQLEKLAPLLLEDT